MHIDYAHRFIKQLKKSPKSVQRAFGERLELFLTKANHPLLHNHSLKGEYAGYRSLNVTGDWRAIFQEINGSTTYFIMIGTHSQLYKK